MIKPIVLLILLHNLTIHATPIITNPATNHTRIGDIFTFISKAVWVAHKYNVPYVHRECAYTDSTHLYRCESFDKHCHKQVVYLTENKEFDPNSNVVYEVAYHYDDNSWGQQYQNDEWQHFKEMKKAFINDAYFMQKLRSLLEPKSFHKPQFPHNVISVAVHIRTGGDFKFDEFNRTVFTLRFMPIHYYAWALKEVCNEYPDQWLYVHLFTDDSYPEKLAEQLYTELADYPLIISYRTTGNRHDANVLEDLWTMSYYNCLIRPWSQYSFYSELFGNHSLIIFPETCIENGYKIGILKNQTTNYKKFIQ